LRIAFAQTLVELAQADERIVLLTADLGFGVLDEFARTHPQRFYNVGVAEANMVGLATGLAESGYIPFLYSIATFASLRPFEQWRNGPVLHRLPVRLIGIGGGFEYGTNGVTHAALEDIGVMRLLPGVQIVIPADQRQAQNALRATYAAPHPIYYRISKNENDDILDLDGEFHPDRVEIAREGKDILLLVAGPLARTALTAADELAASGTDAGVAVMASLEPASRAALADLLPNYRLVVTVESHRENGGVGSLVAESIAEGGYNCRLVRCGVNTVSDGISGSETYMNKKNGLDASTITRRVHEAIPV
jgi:transketolase